MLSWPWYLTDLVRVPPSSSELLPFFALSMLAFAKYRWLPRLVLVIKIAATSLHWGIRSNLLPLHASLALDPHTPNINRLPRP